MENTIAKTKLPVRKHGRSNNTGLLSFDWPVLIEKLKHERNWMNGDLTAMVLLKSTMKQIVLTAMHEGTEIESFQSNGSVTFQIIEGKLKLHTRFGSVTLQKDELLTLRDHTRYNITTREETVFLLTIANNFRQPGEN